MLLSDPIERYRAIFTDRLARREEDETLYMIDVVDRRSHGAQLARLRRFYDPERILVLQFERCRRDPVGQYRRTLDFLEVRDRDFAPRRLRRKAAGKPESLLVAALLRLGLPEGTKRRVTERLTGRPVGARRRAAVARPRGGAAHGARPRRRGAARARAGARPRRSGRTSRTSRRMPRPRRCAERRRSWQAWPVPVPDQMRTALPASDSQRTAALHG